MAGRLGTTRRSLNPWRRRLEAEGMLDLCRLKPSVCPKETLLRINLGDITLWFDVSGPSVVPQGDMPTERPTLVAVHGGPGLDHVNLKAELEPLATRVQVLYYDQRGHGRSDRG